MLAKLKLAALRVWMSHQASSRVSTGAKPDASSIQHIALWQVGGVGDMLLATPVIRALQSAYPEAHIHIWCSDPPFADFLRRFPQVKTIDAFPVYDFDSRTLMRGSVRQEIRDLGDAMAAQKPDMLINLHVPALLDWWAAAWWLVQYLGISYTLGFNPRFVQEKSIFDVSLNAAERDGIHYTRLYRMLLEAAGIACDEGMEFPLADADREKATGLLGECGVMKQPTVCLHIGANRLKLENKMWPLERFIALAEKLVAQGYVPILTGVASEREMAEALCARVPACKNLAGHTSIREMAALISLADGFIGHDSGPFHIAVSVGTPCLAICGRPDAEPEYLAYKRSDVAVLTAASPEGIEVDDVFAQAMQVMRHG